MRRLSSMVLALAALLAVAACAPGPLAPPAPGLSLKSGRYVLESYVAPGVNPGELACALLPFTWAAPPGHRDKAFLKLYQEELARAWQAQGLKVGPPESPCHLSGTIHELSVWGGRFRRFTGRLHARVVLSGTLRQGDQVLFAFRDEVRASSPVAPGPGAPGEEELLLKFLAREAVTRFLNELLLVREPPPSG